MLVEKKCPRKDTKKRERKEFEKYNFSPESNFITESKKPYLSC